MRIGSNIVIVGLVIQVLSFGFFIVAAILFQTRLGRQPTVASKNTSINWRRYLQALYIVSALIFARSIFRIVEYIQGFDGYTSHHEAYLYVFDATLMFVAMLIFNIVYPRGLKSKRAPEQAMQMRSKSSNREEQEPRAQNPMYSQTMA
jgi:hypothetical protein